MKLKPNNVATKTNSIEAKQLAESKVLTFVIYFRQKMDNGISAISAVFKVQVVSSSISYT